jgi:PKD repeat protein/photosystem II stability/assembly factor-like uncharacterized protein
MNLKINLFFAFVGFACNFVTAQITANWKATGPIDFPINASGQINGIGRVCQIKFHPTDSAKIYAASASGGLWMSNNSGLSWQGLGTDNLPSANCASVCIDFTNDSILYLGTGDPNYYNNSIGIWKSSDAGATWAASNSGIGVRMAVELLMNPNNHNEIIAATNDGIWKTYNGGQTWSVKKTGGAFKDMKFKAGAANSTLFAVTSSQYYRSLDMGETWNLITNGVFVPNNNGQGMRLAVSAANPNLVYIGMIAGEGTILKSIDGGSSFTTAYYNPSQSLVGYDAVTSGQGNYNFGINSDPQNASTLFVVAHCVWRSLDEGLTWTKLTNWASDCHTDMHQIEFSPYEPTKLLNANDGGIFLSYDYGDNWDPFSDGIEATECYHAAQSPLDVNMISIGTQDNGELYYDGLWKTNRGGDWTERMAFDYQQFNRVYYFNGDRRAVNGGDQSWNSPYANDANAMLFAPLQPNLAFVASQSVYRTNNLNASLPTWTLIGNFGVSVRAMVVSPLDANDLYVVLNNMQVRHSVNALAASPSFSALSAPSSTANSASIAVLKSNPNVVYITCGSKVYRSANQGTNWTDITFGLPAVNIRKIYIDEFSPLESVYIASATGVYFRNDTMNYWADYSQGLPSIADIQDFMLTNDSSVASRLRVAYYGRGVWETELYQPYLLPQANFSTPNTQVCVGESVTFYNSSSLNAVQFNWTLPGAVPNFSNQKNPIVNYSIPGIYPVTLVVSNSTGSDTLVKIAYIQVKATQTLPLQEGFAGAFPPQEWTLIDAGNDGVIWLQSTNVGAFGTSSECIYFDNYNIDVQGKRDAIRSPQLDLSSLSQARLQFDLAYAMNSAPLLDSLAIYVSNDCNKTLTLVYLKEAQYLATAPPSPNITFVPLSSEWRTEVVNLDAFAGQSNVSIVFENRGYSGQELYIDNINLSEPLTIKTPVQVSKLKVYPNPGNGNFTLELADLKGEVCKLELINSLGKIVETRQFTITQSFAKFDFSSGQNQSGIYFIRIRNARNEVIAQKKISIY